MKSSADYPIKYSSHVSWEARRCARYSPRDPHRRLPSPLSIVRAPSSPWCCCPPEPPGRPEGRVSRVLENYRWGCDLNLSCLQSRSPSLRTMTGGSTGIWSWYASGRRRQLESRIVVLCDAVKPGWSKGLWRGHNRRTCRRGKLRRFVCTW